MSATKTKEFMAEMKVLCKVHHTNLVNLFVDWVMNPSLLTSEFLAFSNLELWLWLWINFVKVELIGYAATGDELFLIYEYAQKGSLGSHLHDPQVKGTLTY